MTLYPKVLTLSSSAFPELVISSAYIINLHRFIFCELGLFSLQPTYVHKKYKINGFKERNVWDEWCPVRFNQKVLPLLHMLTVLLLWVFY